MTEDRLSRIEKKLDQLAETIGTIVRIEERLIAANNRLDLHESRLNSHSRSIDDTREKQIAADSVSRWYSAGFFAFFGGGISLFVYILTR